MKKVLLLLVVVIIVLAGYYGVVQFDLYRSKELPLAFHYSAASSSNLNVSSYVDSYVLGTSVVSQPVSVHEPSDSLPARQSTRSSFANTRGINEYKGRKLIFSDEQMFHISKDGISGCKVIETRETKPDKDGIFQRVRLIKTNYKYPLIRVKEVIKREAGMEDKLISEKSFVGDHIFIKVKSQTSQKIVRNIVAKYDGNILKKMYEPDMYIISFKNASIDTVPNAITTLSAEALVVDAEADYLTY